jgi:hypothetical protein
MTPTSPAFTSNLNNYGPFRHLHLTWNNNMGAANQGNAGVRILRWELQDDMSRWQDGTSNQFLFAEKHIPSWALNSFGCIANSWNGGYQMTFNNETGPNVARVVARFEPAPAAANNNIGVVNHQLFARGPSDPLTDDPTLNAEARPWMSLGSSHMGIVNFLIGDGSVRAISTTTPSEIIYYLTHTHDGTPIVIP